MKTIKILAFVSVLALLTSCGSKQNLAGPQSKKPFGEVYEAPCTEYDTDDYYASPGFANGAQARIDALQLAALTNAQSAIRQKLQHVYRGAIDDYTSYLGNNKGSDAETKMERAGTQLIDKLVHDSRTVCGPKFSPVDDKGDMTCFIGIRVYKKDFIDAVTKHLSQDDELKIRFNEAEFRKRMEENFEKFKGSK